MYLHKKHFPANPTYVSDIDLFEGTTKTVQAPLSAKNSTIFVAI